MRTTLNLEEDALLAAQALARPSGKRRRGPISFTWISHRAFVNLAGHTAPCCLPIRCQRFGSMTAPTREISRDVAPSRFASSGQDRTAMRTLSMMAWAV